MSEGFIIVPFLQHFLNFISIIDPWISLLILLDTFLITVIIYNIYIHKKALHSLDGGAFKKEAENVMCAIKDALASADAFKKGQDEEIKKMEGLLRQAKEMEMNLSAIAAEDIIKDVKNTVGELDEKIKTIANLLTQAVDVEEKLTSRKNEMDRYGEAVRLVTEGAAIEDVAKKLDIPKGEIELVMGLRQALKSENR